MVIDATPSPRDLIQQTVGSVNHGNDDASIVAASAVPYHVPEAKFWSVGHASSEFADRATMSP